MFWHARILKCLAATVTLPAAGGRYILFQYCLHTTICPTPDVLECALMCRGASCLGHGLCKLHLQWQRYVCQSLCIALALTHGRRYVQIIEAYCRYADAMVGRWSIQADGYQTPSLRALLKPLYNIFHGERGGRKWKAAMDERLRLDSSIATLSELIQSTLHHVDPAALDAAPCTVVTTFQPFAAAQTGSWPPDDLPPVKLASPATELVVAEG